MPCDTQARLDRRAKAQMDSALKRLQIGLGDGSVTISIGAQGALAFKGWTDNGGMADLCAYRRLLAENSPELRRALARAEVTAGRQVDYRQVAAGTHSHDGGQTWHKGH